MKKLLLVLALLAIAVPITCSASTILVSRPGLSYTCSPSGPCSGGTGFTVVTKTNPAWSTIPGSQWISYNKNTSGVGSYKTTPNELVMTVTDHFSLTSGQWLTLDVLADDTTSVKLPPYLNIAQASDIGNSYYTCSDLAIGCRTYAIKGHPSTEGTFKFFAKPGSYTVTFGVLQENAYGFGLDYKLTSAPEPASLGMVGSGLILAAGFLRRRFKKS